MSVLGAMPVPMISTRANSAFEIEQLESAPPEWVGGQLGHTRWKKRFHGDLAGTSTVEAVMCMVPDGPMLYVAIERFDCTLDGKAGTFLLTHRAVAVGEQKSAQWVIVDGSGTGELAGISGTGEITDDHDFLLDYRLS